MVWELSHQKADKIMVSEALKPQLNAELSEAYRVEGGYTTLVWELDTQGEPVSLRAMVNARSILDRKFYPRKEVRLYPYYRNGQSVIDGSLQVLHVARTNELSWRYSHLLRPQLRLARIDSSRMSTAALLFKLMQSQGQKSLNSTFWSQDVTSYSLKSFDAKPWSSAHKQLDLPTGSQIFVADLNEHLGSSAKGLYFAELSGELYPEGLAALKNEGPLFDRSLSLVQVTDMGLYWLRGKSKLYVYSYNVRDGKPMGETKLQVYDAQGKLLQELMLGEQGASLPLHKDASYLYARKGEDALLCPLQDYVHVGYEDDPFEEVIVAEDAPQPDRSPYQVSLFLDRNIYRPAETVYLKGYVRHVGEEKYALPRVTTQASLKLMSPQNKLVHEREISVKPDGSIDAELSLPEMATGHYSLVLVLKAEGKTSETKMDLNVQEFRRQEFDFELKCEAHGEHEARIEVLGKSLSGAPLSGAEVAVSLQAKPRPYQSARFKDYLFGDCQNMALAAQKGFLWANDCPIPPHLEAMLDVASMEEGELNHEGKLVLDMSPADSLFPGSYQLSAKVSVTNAHEQSYEKTVAGPLVEGAAVHVGMKTARDSSPFAPDGHVLVELVALDAEDRLLTDAPEMKLRVDYARSDYSRYMQRSEQKLEWVKGKAQVRVPVDIRGNYRISVSGKDAQGREFASRIVHRVYDAQSSPYVFVNRTLTADAAKYKVGEVASIMPYPRIEGEVLVTLAARGEVKSFKQTLTREAPSIQLPISADFMPHAQLRVLFIEPAKSEEQTAQLYEWVSKISVDTSQKSLDIDLKLADSELEPNEQAQISGQVRLVEGQPVPASVTLFAVDEGQLMSGAYREPDPLAYFMGLIYSPMSSLTSVDIYHGNEPFGGSFPHPQGVLRSGSSFEEEFGRARFSDVGEDSFDTSVSAEIQMAPAALAVMPPWVGDEGDCEGGASPRLRQNFAPTALWLASVPCDAQGRFKASFITPDTLTRYRIIAVASYGDEHFGVARTSCEVNKAIMLEPSPPMSATQGDELDIPVTISMNPDALPEASPETVRWRVELQGSEGVVVEQASQSVNLHGNEPQTVVFRVKMKDVGEAKLNYTVKADAQVLAGEADAVQVSFPIMPAAPAQREIVFTELKAGQSLDVAAMLNFKYAEIYKLHATLSLSPYLGALGQVQMLDVYPYGCTEQLSSKCLPLIFADDFAKTMGMSPPDAVSKRKALLSMISKLLARQREDKLFNYWDAEDDEATLFTPYALIMLSSADKQGYLSPSQRKQVDEAMGVIKEALTKGTHSQKAATHPLGLVALAMDGKLDASSLDAIIEKQSGLMGEALGSAAAALSARIIKHPQADALLAKAQKLANDERSYYAPSARYLLKMEQVLRAPKAVESVKLVLSDLAKSAQQIRSTTQEAGWLCLLLSIATQEQGGNDAASFSIAGVSYGAAKSFSRSLSSLEELAALKLESGSAYMQVQVEGRAQKAVEAALNKGFDVRRRYLKLMSNGKWEKTSDFSVGDVVKVELEVIGRVGIGYVAIEDYMPAAFELMNPEVAAHSVPVEGWRRSRVDCSEREYLKDRVRFFYNSWPGASQMVYYARVIKSGRVAAPAAKAEAMYASELYGYAQPQRMTILPKP